MAALLPLAAFATTASADGARWAVITSINAPTDAIRVLDALPGWRTVVVGDLKRYARAATSGDVDAAHSWLRLSLVSLLPKPPGVATGVGRAR